jgi:hypothetical protein
MDGFLNESIYLELFSITNITLGIHTSSSYNLLND